MSPPAPIERAVVDYPATAGQRRMLRRYENGRIERANHLIVAQLQDGLVAVDRLADAFADVFGRHEAFRTRFARDGAAPWRGIVDTSASEGFLFEELAPRQTSEDALLERLAAFAGAPFDLASPPLARAGVFRMGQSDCVCVVIHHAIFDAWSQKPFVRDLAEAFAGGSRTARPAASYTQFARDQAIKLRSPQGQAALASLRAPSEALFVPWRAPADRPDADDDRPAYSMIRVGRATLARLQARCVETAATLYTAILAGLASVVEEALDAPDPAILVARHGREDDVFAGTIGYFVTLAAVQLGGRGTATFREAALRAALAMKAVNASGTTPGEMALLDVDRPGRRPTASILLNYRNTPTAGFPGIGPARALRVQEPQAEYDLSLTIDVKDEGLTLFAKHNTCKVGAEDVRRLLGGLKRWIEDFSDAPDTVMISQGTIA